jgi:hypothetical protein
MNAMLPQPDVLTPQAAPVRPELPSPFGELCELARRLQQEPSFRMGGRAVGLCFGEGSEVFGVDFLAAHTLKIRDRSGALKVLRPNPAQQEFSRRRGQRNIILKARQLGMTTWIAARFFVKTLFLPGTVTLQVAHTLESAQQIFLIVQRFLQNLPEEHLRVVRTVRANVRELAFAHNDSRYIVDTAGNEHAGRGLTVHNLHASEVAMWPHAPRETMAALLAAVPADGCVDIESTPHGAAGYFFEEWSSATQTGGTTEQNFTPHFFPWWVEDSYRIPLLPDEGVVPENKEEELLVEQAQLSPEQVKYRRQLRARFGVLAPQEFAENAEECFLVSGRPVFDVVAIEGRLRGLALKHGSRVEFQSTADVIEWFPPEPGKCYVIGADVAEGSDGGDFSAAVVIDVETGLQCAELCTRKPIGRFAEELARLGKRFNHALIAVERNNHGHAVLYALQHQYFYPRIYRQTDGQGESKPGWLTSAITKPQAINLLGSLLQSNISVFHSRRLLEQCRGYSYLADGSPGALPGAHDDLVMAVAIAHAVRARGAGAQFASVKL